VLTSVVTAPDDRLRLLGVTVLVAVLAFGAWALLRDPSPVDPTKRGPTRWLRVESSAVKGRSLHVSGTTNLVEGATVKVTLGPHGRLFSATAPVIQGAWRIEEEVSAIDSGTYSLQVQFRLEAQSPRIQEALAFQPRELITQGKLVVAADTVSPIPPEITASFLELFAAVNRAPRDPETLDALDKRLLAFSASAGLTRYREASRSLRFAIEVARKKEFSRDEFEQHLLKAHVLAGL